MDHDSYSSGHTYLASLTRFRSLKECFRTTLNRPEGVPGAGVSYERAVDS